MSLFLNKLAKSSSLLIIGTILSGMMGYAYQVLLGRMLGVNDYATLSALLALYAIFSTPLATIMMIVSRKVSEYRAIANLGELFYLFKKVNFYGLIAGILFFLVFWLVSPALRAYMKLESVATLYMLGILASLTIFPMLNNAFLQGMQKFIWFSTLGTCNVFFKIIFSYLLVILGYGIIGAIIGIIFSFILITIVGYIILNISFEKTSSKNKSDLKGMGIQGIAPICIANLAFILMTQLDVILVNYYFPPEDAGIYAAASIMGKAVMYLPSGIALAMFPMVVESHTKNESSSYLLVQAVKLTSVLCGLGALFYFAYGEQVILLLYGERYVNAGYVLKYFGVSIFPMTLVMVAEQFLIAKGRVLFAYLFAAMAPLQLIAIYFFHQSLLTVVFIMGVSGLCSATIGYWMLWKTFDTGK
jgi:O-antigen/teichoic acid export membrane protein